MKSASPNPAERRPPALALTGLSLAALSSALNTSIVNVALPTLTQAFGVSIQAAQWAVIAFVLAITALIVSAGRMADIVGRKRLLLTGLAVFTVSAGACANAPGLGWLIAFRFMQGAGAAIMMALSVALIGDLIPKERTGRVMGLLGSMSATGTALGPALGGWLMAWLGWPAIFWISVPLGLTAFGLVFRFLPGDRAVPAEKLGKGDGWGTVLLALALAAYALGLTRQAAGFGAANVVLLAGAAIALMLFLQVQRTSSAPLLRLELFASDALRAGLGMSLLVSAVMMSTLVVGPFYLARALFVEPGAMGLVLSVGPLVAALIAAPAGRLVDRIGSGVTTVLGLAGAGTGSLALVLLAGRSGVAGYLIPVAVMTAGYSVFQTANNTAVMHGAGAGQRGLIAGLLNLARNLGLVTGAALLGGIFELSMSAAASPDSGGIAAATRMAFSVATAFILAALILALRTLRRPAMSLVVNAADVSSAESSPVPAKNP